MGTQTRTFQRKLLQSAVKINDKGLYWYIEASSKGNSVHRPGCYPKPFIPVVSVGPNEKASYNYISFLVWFFNTVNTDKAWTFEPALTTAELLDQNKLPWYDWLEDIWIDAICTECGAIERVPFSMVEDCDEWACLTCLEQTK